MEQAISYIRVSTLRQGKSGLGLIAQRRMISAFCKANNYVLLKEYREVKSGEDYEKRPEVQKAVKRCLDSGCTLIVATQSRLGRSEYFISKLIRMKVDFISVDRPTADAFDKHVQAAFDERFLVDNSKNTRRSLAVRKAQGHKLGGNVKKMKRTVKKKRRAFLKRIKPIIRRAQKEHKTIRALTAYLNRKRLKKINGKKGGWNTSEVHLVLQRLLAKK
jgi:DNA invertase Pin-like site-specific DNA recombinase